MEVLIPGFIDTFKIPLSVVSRTLDVINRDPLAIATFRLAYSYARPQNSGPVPKPRL
jgi:hypothetical protein